ncbi:unnamed protein product [Darwinula stevensoni]|uniref:Uncharacterized protein n=1 Tax=Darwinula stevensoni TaxID=69355 RepID=A0A7R8XCV6_9CRUS|nr:unnamed protein product [Darwinula stevensoni]CAG0892617.1 unnamed protein product [Darwinula stevensoni]
MRLLVLAVVLVGVNAAIGVDAADGVDAAVGVDAAADEVHPDVLREIHHWASGKSDGRIAEGRERDAAMKEAEAPGRASSLSSDVFHFVGGTIGDVVDVLTATRLSSAGARVRAGSNQKNSRGSTRDFADATQHEKFNHPFDPTESVYDYIERESKKQNTNTLNVTNAISSSKNSRTKSKNPIQRSPRNPKWSVQRSLDDASPSEPPLPQQDSPYPARKNPKKEIQSQERDAEPPRL